MRAQLLGHSHRQVIYEILTVFDATRYPTCPLSSTEPSIQTKSKVDFVALLAHFQTVQQRHQQHRVSQRRRKVALWDQPVRE